MAGQFWKYDYSPGNWMRVPVYRRPQYAPPTQKEPHWTTLASCNSLPPDLFEFNHADDNSISQEETLKEHESKFEQARKACSTCPVFHLCYLNAQEVDFHYTLRAGIDPVQYTRWKSEGVIRYRSDQRLANEEKCKNGHNNWVIWGKARPRRKCIDCNRVNTAKAGAKSRAKNRQSMVD